MKKKLCYLILVSLMVMIPVNAKALTGSINITCDSEEYGAKETATCKITGTSDVEVYSISAKVNSTTANATFTADSSWQGNGDDGNIQLYTDNGKKGTFNIGTLKVSSKDTDGLLTITDVNLYDIKYGDTDGKEFDIGNTETRISFVEGSSADRSDSNSSNSTSTSSIKNPSTADTKIALVTLGILVAGAFITIGYKEVKKKNN